MSAENLLQTLQQVEHRLRRPVLRRAVAGIVLILSVGYLGRTLARNWSELVAYNWQIDYGLAVPAFGCYSLALGSAVLGWTLIVRRLAPSTGLRKHLKYYTYANLLKHLPAPLLDVLGRAYLYEQEGVGKSTTVMVSLLEWGVLVSSGFVVYLLTSPFLPLPPVWRTPWIPLSLLVIGAVLFRPKTLRTVLRQVGQEDLLVSFNYGDLLGWLAVYSVVWIVGGVVLHLGINSIHQLPWHLLPAVVGIWVISGLVPTLMLVTPAGLGLKEVTLSLLLGYLIPPPVAVIVALLMRVALILFEIVWGLIGLNL